MGLRPYCPACPCQSCVAQRGAAWPMAQPGWPMVPSGSFGPRPWDGQFPLGQSQEMGGSFAGRELPPREQVCSIARFMRDHPEEKSIMMVCLCPYCAITC